MGFPCHHQERSHREFHSEETASSGAGGERLSPFVIYDLRHTCLTRWAKTMDPFTLMKLAGHADLNTTMRYVHLNDDDVREAMNRAEQAKGGHKNRHSAQTETLIPPREQPVLN